MSVCSWSKWRPIFLGQGDSNQADYVRGVIQDDNLPEPDNQGMMPDSKALWTVLLGHCSHPKHLNRWVQTLPIMPFMGAS